MKVLWKTAFFLVLVTARWPSSVWACSCMRPQRSVVDRYKDMSAVFIGYAIDHADSRRRVIPPDPELTTFVVEERWKGPNTETVQVAAQVLGNCTVSFVPGRRYLVFARDTEVGLFIPICDGESPDLNPYWTRSRQDAAERARYLMALLDSLGPSTWQAPPPIQGFPSGVITSNPSDTMSVFFLLERHDTFTADPGLEIIGIRRTAKIDSYGFFVLRGVPAGIYVARLQYANGVAEDHYISVRCTAINGHCSAGRPFYPAVGEIPWRSRDQR